MAFTIKVNAAAAKEAASGGDFKPYAPGDYIVEIKNVVEGEFAGANSKGLPKWEVHYTIVDPDEFAGKKFRDFNVPVFTEWKSGKSAFMFYQFFGALGVDFSEDGEVELPDPDDTWGEQIGVTLGIEEYNDKPRNVVKRYFPAADGIKNVPAYADEEEDAGGNTLNI